MKKNFLMILALMGVLLMLCACQTQECRHTFGDWQEKTPATCAAEGLLSRVCTVCSTEETKPVERLTHTPVTDPAVSPSCKESGKTEGSHCSVCNQVLIAQQTIDKLEHTPLTDPAVSATCTAEGLTEGSHCQVCQTVLVSQEKVGKLSHTPGKWIVDRAATCVTSGSRHKNCTVCGQKAAEEKIAAKGHSFGVWKNLIEPTCDESGTARRVCSCGEAEEKTVTEKGHNFTNGACTICLVSEFSKGLKFELRDDSYWVSGIGECTDKVLRFPKEHEGKKVVGIATNAFLYEHGFTGIVIPEGYHTIEAYAFRGGSELKTVQLPASLKKIDQGAFNGTGIVTIRLPEQLDSLGESVFSGCQSLVSVKLPEGITEIGNTMFYNCEALEEVILPSTVTSIGRRAFYGCTALKRINLPASLTGIEESAFYGCSSLESVTLPEGIQTIKSRAFASCSKLTFESCAMDLSNVNAEAFSGVKFGELTVKGTTLTDALISAKIGKLILAEGVTTIEEEALRDTRIDQLILPKSLSTVGDNAFYRSNISSITFRSAVTLGRTAFHACGSLKSVTLPKGSVVGSNAFKDCTALETIRFGGTKDEWYAMVRVPVYSTMPEALKVFEGVNILFNAT